MRTDERVNCKHAGCSTSLYSKYMIIHFAICCRCTVINIQFSVTFTNQNTKSILFLLFKIMFTSSKLKIVLLFSWSCINKNGISPSYLKLQQQSFWDACSFSFIYWSSKTMSCTFWTISPEDEHALNMDHLIGWYGHI